MSYDYAIETRLKSLSPALHRTFADNVLCCQNLLQKYKTLFPSFTDHTALHSVEIIAFCNELIGDYCDRLNEDEIFILLMAAYLHDSGMGISQKDYDEFKAFLPVDEFLKQNPGADVSEIIRSFHNELSGMYIKKYASIFEFPSKEHLWATIQVSRGHRKTNLFDEAEYPSEYKLPGGNTVCLPYLSALIRLGDELDIAADRNLQFVYDLKHIDDEKGRIEFSKHLAIKKVVFEPDCFAVTVDDSDAEIYGHVIQLFEKLQYTLDQCVSVCAQRTPYRIKQTAIKINKLSQV